jgi:hypothetical protein
MKSGLTTNTVPIGPGGSAFSAGLAPAQSGNAGKDHCTIEIVLGRSRGALTMLLDGLWTAEMGEPDITGEGAPLPDDKIPFEEPALGGRCR